MFCEFSIMTFTKKLNKKTLSENTCTLTIYFIIWRCILTHSYCFTFSLHGCAENTILRFAYVYIMSCLAAHPYMDSFS